MSGPSKRDLAEALDALASVTPEEYLVSGSSRSARCHHCLASFGRRHDAGCPWVDAKALLAGDDSVRARLVGESDEDFEDRLADEDDLEDEDPRECLRASAAAARAEVASHLGTLPRELAREVPRDAVEEILDLEPPEPWEDPEKA